MTSFSRIEDAIAAIARGDMVVAVDNENRENEGDLIMAAEAVTPAAVNFMMTRARGLICVTLPGERLDELRLPPMVERNSESMRTAFTVSVDFLPGTSTGISAADRATTIRALVDVNTAAADFARPGHVFPLRAHKLGVVGRQGHTEAATDMSRMAGFRPGGAICEIANDDGTMARLPQLKAFAHRHGLHIISIDDLLAYRRRAEIFVRRKSMSELPTKTGLFQAVAYEDLVTGVEHIALLKGDFRGRHNLTVRIHSECMTGDVFGSSRCDCGDQLQLAMSIIEGEGAGCVVYLRGQEGRGIGLGNKIAAYDLQDKGLDTADANTALGLPIDGRDYLAASGILKDLGLNSVVLLTNNPDKVRCLSDCGIEIVKRRGLLTPLSAENAKYISAKKTKFGHCLEVA